MDYFYALAKYYLKENNMIDPKMTNWMEINTPSVRVINETFSYPHPLAAQYGSFSEKEVMLPMFRFKDLKEAEAFGREFNTSVWIKTEPYCSFEPF